MVKKSGRDDLHNTKVNMDYTDLLNECKDDEQRRQLLTQIQKGKTEPKELRALKPKKSKWQIYGAEMGRNIACLIVITIMAVPAAVIYSPGIAVRCLNTNPANGPVGLKPLECTRLLKTLSR